jgi:hypothetical protein
MGAAQAGAIQTDDVLEPFRLAALRIEILLNLSSLKASVSADATLCAFRAFSSRLSVIARWLSA